MWKILTHSVLDRDAIMQTGTVTLPSNRTTSDKFSSIKDLMVHKRTVNYSLLKMFSPASLSLALAGGNYLPTNIYLRFLESLLIWNHRSFIMGSSDATVYFGGCRWKKSRKKQDLAALDKDFNMDKKRNEIPASKLHKPSPIWMLQILNAAEQCQ